VSNTEHRVGNRVPESLLITVPAPQAPSSLEPRATKKSPRWLYWVSLPLRAVAVLAAVAGMLVLLLLNWVAFTGAFVVDLVLKPRRWRELCRGHFVNRPRKSVAMLGWVALRIMAPPGYPVSRPPIPLG
jgi:fatty acid desaturase